MKAIRIAGTGGPERLVLEEVSDPGPGPGEALVDVEFAGVNFIDVYHRIGLYPVAFPFVPGGEGAGTVSAVGEGVTWPRPGERVGWATGAGSYAEKAAIPVQRLIPIPEGVSTALAAAVLLQGITAQFLCNDTFRLAAGHRCLIHAGAGGVGLLLTRMAKLKGATVITTVGAPEKAVLSREAGADDVIVYTEVDFKEAAESLAGPHAFDVVYDGVGAATFEGSIDLLRPRGLMVCFGNASGPPPEISPLLLAAKGSIFLTRPTMSHYLATREELMERAATVLGMVASGELPVRIGARFPLARAADAHRALEGRVTTGKVILEVGGP